VIDVTRTVNTSVVLNVTSHVCWVAHMHMY